MWCDEPPEPAWALDASAQVLRERLAAATTDPADGDVARLIEVLAPTGVEGAALPCGLGPAGVVDGIVAAQRVINHFQAVQRQWIAALARPGVAVPLEQLVDLCQRPGRHVPGALRPPAELPGDLPTDADGEPVLRPLLSHPAWRGPLADTAARVAAAQIGCALHLAPVTARIRTEAATTVIDALPAAHTAQCRGDVDGYRVAIITDATDVLDGKRRRAVVQQVLPGAAARPPGALRGQVDRAVIAADPAAAAERARQATARRGVWLDKDRDDMAVLRATVGAVHGQIAFGVLDEQAAAIAAAGLAGGRGMSQLRADVFCDLWHALARTGHAHLTSVHPITGTGDTAGSGDHDAVSAPAGRVTGVASCHGHCTDTHPPHAGRSPGGRAGTVAGTRRSVALNVYLDAATLAGLADRPGELSGYGTITGDTARALAASADTIRALIIRPATHDGPASIAGRSEHGPDPAPHSGIHTDNPTRSRTCGTILDAGRAVYRPPDPVMDYVTARDRTCCWPGCRASARRCDADHRRPFGDGGATCPCDLDLLCRWHHRVKTFTAWRAEPGPDGQLIWISPTGHRYPTEPGHPLLDSPELDRPPQDNRNPTTAPATPTTNLPDDDPPPF